MSEQPGTAQHRLQTSWCTVHQSVCSSSFALQRHLPGYGTGIESREQLVQGVGARGRPAASRPLHDAPPLRTRGRYMRAHTHPHAHAPLTAPDARAVPE